MVPGIQYQEFNDTIFLKATGDPTFLLQEFSSQSVLEYLQTVQKPLFFIEPEWETRALGHGWPWNFYLDYYMAERSPFPLYGNGIHWAQREMAGLSEEVSVSYILSSPRHPWPVEIKEGWREKLEVTRPLISNDYTIYPGMDGDRELFVPFATNGMQAALELLGDTLNREVGLVPSRPGLPDEFRTIYSGSADSLLRSMMFFSDNFFAEQTLIMTSRNLFGVMDEKPLIDFLIEHDLAAFPQKPRWVDGSGLSRYNLFSPRSIVWLIEKLNDEFGFERISGLLPTGGEGTLEGFYSGEQGRIFAKTGTLDGNVVALSGFLKTGKNRTLIFSVLVNNHNKPAEDVRRAIEYFLKEVIYRY
jgi:serine-type D-Ala-D-Ala carboxypeptidase/endopeptidase (penicillin-binding protein 4)